MKILIRLRQCVYSELVVRAWGRGGGSGVGKGTMRKYLTKFKLIILKRSILLLDIGKI